MAASPSAASPQVAPLADVPNTEGSQTAEVRGEVTDALAGVRDHRGPADPELTDLGLVEDGEAAMSAVAGSGEGSSSTGQAASDPEVVTFVIAATDDECDEALEVDPENFPDRDACTGRYAAAAQQDQPADSTDLASDDGGTTSNQTVYLKTWSQSGCSIYGCWAWEEIHDGATYWNGSQSWVGNHNGYNDGYHACGNSSGIGYSITVQQCWEVGDPSASVTSNRDRFTASAVVDGFPISASHTLHADVYPNGDFVTSTH